MDEFGRVVTDLVKDFEMDATCTIKFHVCVCIRYVFRIKYY